MIRYKDLYNRSGVLGYEYGQTFITVYFKSNDRPYTYSINKAGRIHVNNMISLAKRGYGLNSYILKHCSKLYD